MDPRYDIKLLDDDAVILNNDLVWDISDPQHIQDTINAWPGWWIENFSDGVGVRSYLNSSGQKQILARSVTLQLQSDLYTVENPQIDFDSNGVLNLQPNAS